MQNQQNTGYSPHIIVNSYNVASLKQLWHYNFGGLARTLVISRVSVKSDGSGLMIAVNETSGRLIWRDGPGVQTGFKYLTIADATIDSGNAVRRDGLYSQFMNLGKVRVDFETSDSFARFFQRYRMGRTELSRF